MLPDLQKELSYANLTAKRRNMAAQAETQMATHELHKNKPGPVRRLVYWVGEKSPYITFPLSAAVAVGGAITGAWAAVALGGVGMATDVIQHRYFKAKRAKEAGATQFEHSMQQSSTEASNSFLRKLREQLGFGERSPRRGHNALAMGA
jgi:hypothetical protein